MEKIITLTEKISTKGLNSLNNVATLYHEFFVRHDYKWWYQVSPGDIVVDIGACNGMFTCSALDSGAKKVFAVEPNLELLETTVINAFPHIVNKLESPLIPINCLIGKGTDYSNHIIGIGDNRSAIDNIPSMTFREFIEKYNITNIDYLKIDAEGAEYDIFSQENLDFIKDNVKHIAVEVHLDVFPSAPDKFIEFRDNFLNSFDQEKIKFLYAQDRAKTYDDTFIKSKWPIGWGNCWMIYICNKSI